MSTQNSIPSEIASIIKQKRLAIEAERKDKDAREKAERAAKISEGRKVLREKITAALQAVPTWLHQYDVSEFDWDDGDLERVGTHGALKDIVLVFHIPGLAPIQFNSQSNNWRAAQAYEEWNGDWSTPTVKFNNSSYWRTDLEYTLIYAEQEMQNYDELQARYEMRKLEAEIRAAEDSQREQETERENEEETIQERSEAEQLFQIFKDDPVAVNLMKAFLMINRERSMLISQIEDASNSLCSMEDYWSGKAAQLRKQADEAQRRAEEERYRAEDIQSDLDKAEKKLKQSERGW